MAPDWHQIGLDWIGSDWNWIRLENWKIIVGTKSWPLIGTGVVQDWP